MAARIGRGSRRCLFVYLEDVDESGRVTYVTEGTLRLLQRKVSTGTTPYKQFIPYHSFRKKDASPVVPGELMELKFGLLPTSMLFKKGHRIRVAVAGHDKSVFARTPSTGTPTISIERSKRHASFIELPVMRRAAGPVAPVNLLTSAPAPTPAAKPPTP